MGTTYSFGELNNGTGQLTGVNYSDDFTTLNQNLTNLTQAVNNLTNALNLAIGPTSVQNSLGKTAVASMNQLKAINSAQTGIHTKIGESFGVIQGITNQLSGIAATLNNGVAAQYILTANTIKKNAFDKSATQAALKRNNLPEVTVTEANFLEDLQTTLQESGNVALQATATGFVSTQANAALGTAGNYILGLLPSPATIFNSFKSLLPAKAADKDSTLLQTNNSALLITTPFVATG